MTADGLFGGKLIMAPMTHGTDLPFRRLLVEYGAEVIVGEMAYAHKVVRSGSGERALMRRHPEERCFGVQLAGKLPAVMAEAAVVAEQAGADFVDVNLGCPIQDATRRGFGAALLKRAGRTAEIVAAMKKAVSIPITVKLRLGWSSEKPTFVKVAMAAQEAGADAITLHARSRAQRYRRPADWQAVAELAEAVRIPVIGNGDLMHWSDAERRREQSGCAAVMIGRWALAKPWIFREYAERRDLDQDAEGRLSMIKRYVELCLEHFGDDEHGRRRTRRFLVFHQDFFRRYRLGSPADAVNSDDPRNWGVEPQGELESWLCRADVQASERLADWLVDGGPAIPPDAEPVDARRAVRVAESG